MPQHHILPFPQKESSLPSLLKPISPSGQFSPSDNFTSSGRPKAQGADPLRSYADYARVRDYMKKNNVRDSTLFTLGINTGLRVSDLVSLKIGHLITSDENGNSCFLKTITINAQKTGKSTKGLDDEIFITEAMRNAVSEWLVVYTEIMREKGKMLDLDDWLFYSKQPQRNQYVKKNGKLKLNPQYGEHVLTPESVNRPFGDAKRDLKITYRFSTHSMRNTFACLLYKISSKTSTANYAAVEDVQRSLQHATSRVTMRYLKITKHRSEMLRNAISDFLMGKSDIEIIE